MSSSSAIGQRTVLIDSKQRNAGVVSSSLTWSSKCFKGYYLIKITQSNHVQSILLINIYDTYVFTKSISSIVSLFSTNVKTLEALHYLLSDNLSSTNHFFTLILFKLALQNWRILLYSLQLFPLLQRNIVLKRIKNIFTHKKYTLSKTIYSKSHFNIIF